MSFACVSIFALLAAQLILAACATTQRAADSSRPSESTPSSTGPQKTLRIGVEQEPPDFLGPLTSIRTSAWRIADVGLTTPSPTEILPTIAAELPSLGKGTWKIFPDQRMEVTWKLRQNVLWHDGHPMTSDDILFFFEYTSHPKSELGKLVWMPLVHQVHAPDPYTIVISFKGTHAQANEGHASSNPLVRAFPRHILGGVFASGDLDAFHNSPHWRDGFTGLGPYKLVEWQQGSSMEFTRFEGFFLGRPPLDRVILRFLPDVNTLISNILAGEIQLVWEGTLDAAQSVELRRRWEGTENQVLVGDAGSLRHLTIQFRPDVDVAPAGLRERATRQALLRALDREAFGQVVHMGLAQVPDSWIPPSDPRRRLSAVRDSMIHYPYDPARAQREFESLGWRKGPDGILMNQQGERFEFELRSRGQSVDREQIVALQGLWKPLGVSVVLNPSPPALSGQRDFDSLSTGMLLSGNGYKTLETSKFHTRQIGTPANRYAGFNLMGYSNPQLDALYDRLQETIPRDDRIAVQNEILQLGLTELPAFFVAWNVKGTPIAAGVKNIGPPTPDGAEGWNMWQWDIVQ